MKKSLLLFGLGLLLMQSCQSDSPGLQPPDELLTDQFKPEEATGVQHDIMVNILASKFGGYKKGVTNTRAAGAVSLTPYIENSDTLLYIAQYEKGWELYSASTAAPMVIFSSPDGVFDINDPDMPEAMRDLIYSSAGNVAKLKADKVTDIHPSWASIAAINADTPDGKITVKTAKGVQKVVVPSDLPPGHWVLIDSEEIDETENPSPKLIKTKWGQKYPWNQYAKYVKVNDNSNTYWQAVAGCMAVALSQYMYFTHHKDGVPSTTVSYATPTSDGHDFTFGGSSSTIWDNMALEINSSFTQMENSALLIGYTGRKIGSDYGLNNTLAYGYIAAPYLSQVYKDNTTRQNYSLSTVKNLIDKGYPVIAEAFSDKKIDGTTLNEQIGHAFIIDQYIEIKTTYHNIYGYEVDSWNPDDGDDPWDDGDVDEEGNVTGYAYYKESDNTVTNYDITMNWGYAGLHNSDRYSSSYNWTVDSIVYNLNHLIYIRDSLK